MFSTHHREFYFASAEGKPACYKIRVMNLSFEETEHRKADRTVGVNCFVRHGLTSSGNVCNREKTLQFKQQSLYRITIKSGPLKLFTNDKIIKIEINKN